LSVIVATTADLSRRSLGEGGSFNESGLDLVGFVPIPSSRLLPGSDFGFVFFQKPAYSLIYLGLFRNLNVQWRLVGGQGRNDSNQAIPPRGPQP
jgi:hypothetical protein